MHSAFGYVIWIVCGVGIVVAAIALIGSGKLWEEFGRSGLMMEREPSRHQGATGLSDPARDTEIRQMLEARNHRRARRGEAPIDIEAELARLTAPAIDDELRDEIRQMVVARNHRRARRGQPPLDVATEIEREISRLTQL